MAASEESAQVEAVGARGLIPYRWELMFLFWFAYFFNQADRQIYGVVLPLIKEDLGSRAGNGQWGRSIRRAVY